MANINPPILAFFALIIPLLSSGQSTPVRYEVEAQAIGTTNKVVPFWMRSNQYGSIPLTGVSGSFIGRVYKDYMDQGPYTSDSKLVDWAAGFQGRANLGSGSNLQLIEAYAKLRVGMFQLQAGRTRDVMGLNGDTTLSSGNFAVSGNALGIPKVEISIPEYWTIPWFDGLFAVKGNFAHGWVGKATALHGHFEPGDPREFQKVFTFLHQKSLYGRLGRESWKLKLHGGFSHQAFWGNERQTLGDDFNLSNIQGYFYVVFGKAYRNKSIPSSKIGNQLGSIDLGLDYNFKNLSLSIYRQNFYDVGALSRLANIRDGLNGLVIRNKKSESEDKDKVTWKTFLFEFLYTKDQAGYPWSVSTRSGDEDYYNNYFYTEGWSYNHLGLGTPLITQRDNARFGQVSDPLDFFISNRVIAYHIGTEVRVREWNVLSKLSYSKNYGTFGTSTYGKSTGSEFFPPSYGLFESVDQFSYYISGRRPLTESLKIGVALAGDTGKLLNNSFGSYVSLTIRF